VPSIQNDLEAGNVTITAEIAKTGEVIGSIAVVVRANGMVQADLVPRVD
jgi:hypothetical protein